MSMFSRLFFESYLITDGDSVKLRSGGPAMTVTKIRVEDGEIRVCLCVWFERRDRIFEWELKQREFPVHALRKC